MKSMEEIERRLKAAEESPVDLKSSTEASYLKLALDCYKEPHWLNHLIMKYSFEVKEDQYILDALKWVMDKEDEI